MKKFSDCESSLSGGSVCPIEGNFENHTPTHPRVGLNKNPSQFHRPRVPARNRRHAMVGPQARRPPLHAVADTQGGGDTVGFVTCCPSQTPPMPVAGSLERSVNILQAWPCKPLRSIRFHLNYTHPASQRAGGSAESESEVRAVLTNICDALFSPFVQSGKYLFRGLVYFSICLPHNARMKDCGRKEIGQDWCAGSGSIKSEFKLFGTGSGMMCPLCGALRPRNRKPSRCGTSTVSSTPPALSR